VSIYKLEVEELRVEMVHARYTVTASCLALAARKALMGFYDEREELCATELGTETVDVITDGETDTVCGTETFAPGGDHSVYLLWGDDEERPVYIGQSTKVLARLGQHMSDADKRSRTKPIEVIHCTSAEEMNTTEQELIGELEPYLNRAYNLDALARRGEAGEWKPVVPKQVLTARSAES